MLIMRMFLGLLPKEWPGRLVVIIMLTRNVLLLDNFTPHKNARKVRIQVGRNNHDVVCATNGLIEHNYQTGRR